MPDHKLLKRLVKRLPVMVRVINEMRNHQQDSQPNITDGAYYITPDGAMCADNCAAYLVMTVLRGSKQLDTFMKVTNDR